MALDLKSYFANVPPKQLYILIGVGAAAILGLYGYLLMWPLWEEKDKHEEEPPEGKSEENQEPEPPAEGEPDPDPDAPPA